MEPDLEMNRAEKWVNPQPPNDPILSYLVQGERELKSCMVCGTFNSSRADAEVLKMCVKCDGHIHMKCFWKIPAYESKNGIRCEDIRKCPMPLCQTVGRITYNKLTYSFPNYKSQKWLYVLNPLLWLLAAASSLIFLIVFMESFYKNAPIESAFAIQGFAAFIFFCAFFLKPSEPIIYLELSGCKAFAFKKIYTEMTLVVLAFFLGMSSMTITKQIWDSSLAFAIWIIVFDLFILPILCLKYLRSHKTFYDIIDGLSVEISIVSLASSSQWSQLASNT